MQDFHGCSGGESIAITLTQYNKHITILPA